MSLSSSQFSWPDLPPALNNMVQNLELGAEELTKEHGGEFSSEIKIAVVENPRRRTPSIVVTATYTNMAPPPDPDYSIPPAFAYLPKETL